MRLPIENLSRRLGYKFAQQELLEQALTHRSANAINNERLEFLGDALLGFIVAETLFLEHDKADEGQLSRLRAGLVKRESLAELARSIELGEYLNLGVGELRSGGYTRDSILADAMEAVLAAVYLDSGGLSAVQQLLRRLYGERLHELIPAQELKDPKTKLQELLQSRGSPLPEYGVLDICGNQHEQAFRVFCRVTEHDNAVVNTSTTGSGASRRRAEQQAAKLMLEQLASADKMPAAKPAAK